MALNSENDFRAFTLRSLDVLDLKAAQPWFQALYLAVEANVLSL